MPEDVVTLKGSEGPCASCPHSRQQHGRSETEEYSSDSESESEDEEELQVILEDLQRQNEELEVSPGREECLRRLVPGSPRALEGTEGCLAHEPGLPPPSAASG